MRLDKDLVYIQIRLETMTRGQGDKSMTSAWNIVLEHSIDFYFT